MSEDNEITMNNFDKYKDQWKVIHMKSFCKKHNIPIAGKKVEIKMRIDTYISSELTKVEKSLSNLSINDNVNIISKKYVKFDKPINTKLKTIYFDYIKNRFYIVIDYKGKERIDNLVKCFKEDTKDIKKKLKDGILYKNCKILFLGYWISNDSKKIYDIDY
jgi:ribosome-associated translation inhibitor RaiA